jgi:hypothetical protein
LLTRLCSFIHSSMDLQPFVGPWPHFQFRNFFFIQTVRLLIRVISLSQGRYLHTGQHKHTINVHTNIHVFEWYSNPRFQRSSEWRQLMP